MMSSKKIVVMDLDTIVGSSVDKETFEKLPVTKKVRILYSTLQIADAGNGEHYVRIKPGIVEKTSFAPNSYSEDVVLERALENLGIKSYHYTHRIIWEKG